MDTTLIRLGSRVRVRYNDGEAEFNIVSDEDADASASRVSVESPIARALLGHRSGDDVRFYAPDGLLSVTIISATEPDAMGHSL